MTVDMAGIATQLAYKGDEQGEGEGQRTLAGNILCEVGRAESNDCRRQQMRRGKLNLKDARVQRRDWNGGGGGKGNKPRAGKECHFWTTKGGKKRRPVAQKAYH